MSEHVHEPGLPLEQFITALTSQLDRAQNAMAIKARLGYPLTFAVKELTLDLRTHVEMVGSVVQIRPAGPGETEASTIHLALTTITRPMMEENTMQLSAAPGEPTLQEALGDKLTDEEKRRLEWAGVQTVSQLVELERHSDPDTLSKIANVPAMRLRAALDHAARPMVHEVVPVEMPYAPRQDPLASLSDGRSADEAPAARDDLGSADGPSDGMPLRRVPMPSLHPSALPSPAGPQPNASLAPAVAAPAPTAKRLLIRGRNLLRDGQPQVSIGGRPLRIVRASATELLVEAPHEALVGTLSVETRPGMAFTMELDAGHPAADSGSAAPVRASGPVHASRPESPVESDRPEPATGSRPSIDPADRNGRGPATEDAPAHPADAVRPADREDEWALAPAGYHDGAPPADEPASAGEGRR